MSASTFLSGEEEYPAGKHCKLHSQGFRMREAYLILVGMPELSFFLRQRLEQAARDDVLDADEARIVVCAVVDDALPHLLIQVRAIVVRLNLQGNSKAMTSFPEPLPPQTASGRCGVRASVCAGCAVRRAVVADTPPHLLVH